MTYPPPISRHRRSPLIERTEPGKLPAALLAIVVHGAFFALLVIGVSWQVKHPVPAITELWEQLPPIQNVRDEPAPPVPIEPEVVSPPKVEPKVEKAPPQPTQADINLQAKRAKLEKEAREKQLRDEKVLKEKQKQAEVEKKRKEDEAKQKAIQKIADDKARAEQRNIGATVRHQPIGGDVGDMQDRQAGLRRRRAFDLVRGVGRQQ